jgi:poly(ADP-ribose) glycohydrolase
LSSPLIFSGGCGAFGGYHDLKAVIQLLAASEAQRDLKYYTFGVKGLAPSFLELHNVLKKGKVTVGMFREMMF